MKKLVFLLVCLFTLQTVARADDDKPIQVTQMHNRHSSLSNSILPTAK